MPLVPLLGCRVTVTRRTRADFEAQYRRAGIDVSYVDRIAVVTNRVAVPDRYPRKPMSGVLTALYVGRGTEEKRVHLIAEVARQCREAALPYTVVLGGDLSRALRPDRHPYCRFLGRVSDPHELERLYRTAHVLLLTSSREGFPLVIMEAMAHGVVPIATNVGGIAEHVVDGVNGLLIDATQEADVVRAMKERLERLQDRSRLERMSLETYAYARRHFAGETSCAAYRKILRAGPPNR